MQGKPDHRFLASFFKRNIGVIVKEFDLKVAETKKKHFVVITCSRHEKISATAYEFTFYGIDSPSLSKLDLISQETILNTKLNDHVCFIIIDEKKELTLMTYKRDKVKKNWVNN